MADGIKVAQQFKDQARVAVYTGVSTIPMISSFAGTLDQAIDAHDMRVYVENMIAVRAADMAYISHLTNSLHEDTFSGKFSSKS